MNHRTSYIDISSLTKRDNGHMREQRRVLIMYLIHSIIITIIIMPCIRFDTDDDSLSSCMIMVIDCLSITIDFAFV